MKDRRNDFKFEMKDLLDEFFTTREEEIYNITDCERELVSKKSKDYAKIYTAIENIPDGFVETIESIKTSIETYLETLTDIQGIENEKFYKFGFSDAVNLFMECLCKNRDSKK